MKILAISDPHGDYSKIRKMMEKAGDFDLVVIVGDITHFGPDEKVEELMELFDKPVLAIPGNCDQRSILKTLDASKATNLHGKIEQIGNISFIGLGGSNPTPFNTPFELSEEEIEKALEGMVCSAENTGECGTIVLLTHIHEAKGLEKVGKTVVLNPGEASKGSCALVHLDEPEGKPIEVEFVEV